MNRRVLELVNTLIFVFALLGTNLIDLLGVKVGQTEKIAASVLLVTAYLAVSREKRFERVHRLEEESRRFYKFFADWYSRRGTLTIFCSDLDWLTPDGSKKVVDALRKKGDKLHLYLRNNANDPIAKQLIANGASFSQIGEHIRTSHRLSILDNDGIQSVIIRNKDVATDKVIFVETNSYRDPYIIGLALDMLDDCKR